MAVYVDPLFDTEGWSEKWPFPQACHMMADSIEELVEMADKLKLKRNWIQCTSVVHFDLTKGKRWQAIRHGAKEVDRGFKPDNYKEQVTEFKEIMRT